MTGTSGVATWTDQAAAGGTQNATNYSTTGPRAQLLPAGFGAMDRPCLRFNGTNLLTTGTALFTGATSRTIVAAYRVAAAGTNKQGCMVAGQVNASNGQSFFLQSRGVAGSEGNPYAAGWNADLSSGVKPVADLLVFAATAYNGTTLSLSWAFGSNTNVSATSTNRSLTTANVAFWIGARGTGYENAMYGDIAEIRVYDTAFSTAERADAVRGLQDYYMIPEPASVTGLAACAVLLYGRRVRRRPRAATPAGAA